MEKYQTPELKFETVTFFEKIACTCWESKKFSFDLPKDRKKETKITICNNDNRCENLADGGLVLAKIASYLGPCEFLAYSKKYLKNTNNTFFATSKIEGLQPLSH